MTCENSETPITPTKRRLTRRERSAVAIGIALLGVLLTCWLLACVALVWDAWTYDERPSEAQIRWDLLDNEWDRNMHDPTQRPPDSIAAEARLKMLLLEEEKK